MLDDKLRELALFEATQSPCLSLYLNTQADQHGKDNFDAFVRKQLESQAAAFAPRTPERESYDADAERIAEWLRTELQPSANGAVVFACNGASEFFEGLQFDAPIDTHRFSVSALPNLYPLARLNSAFPAYAAVVADTNSARLYVFGLSQAVNAETVDNEKVRSRTQVGGWSQARYQRHVRNYHLQHSKEVVEQLQKLTREQDIQSIVFAGDEVILPLLRENLPPVLANGLIGDLRLSIDTPEHEVLKATQAFAQEQQAKNQGRDVTELLETSGAKEALAAIRLQDVVPALMNGQVETLYLHPSIEQQELSGGKLRKLIGTLAPLAEPNKELSPTDALNALVIQAYRTSARVRVVEEDALAEAGGVGASLRYRV